MGLFTAKEKNVKIEKKEEEEEDEEEEEEEDDDKTCYVWVEGVDECMELESKCFEELKKIIEVGTQKIYNLENNTEFIVVSKIGRVQLE